MKKKKGFLVDIPKPGTGTSNTGTIARKFFSNSALTASIAGINEELIHRLGVLLSAISREYEINKDVFDDYVKKIAEVLTGLRGKSGIKLSFQKVT